MPANNARRIVEIAAHLTDSVLPDLPLRQWVLAVPKRLRYFLQRHRTSGCCRGVLHQGAGCGPNGPVMNIHVRRHDFSTAIMTVTL